MPVLPDKVARKVTIPMAPILDLLRRRGLKNPILREVRGDVRQAVVLMHLECENEAGADLPPYDFAVDWNEVFGFEPPNPDDMKHPLADLP